MGLEKLVVIGLIGFLVWVFVPFIFDHVSRILRFKGFSDPIHESKIFNNSPPDPDWDLVRFNESLESIDCGYYSAIDAGFAAVRAMTI